MIRLLRVSLVGGSAPKPPGFFRFFSARMGAFFVVVGGRQSCCRPGPFRPRHRSLELLPSRALSLPMPVGSLSTPPLVRSTKKQRTAITPLTESGKPLVRPVRLEQV
jgi:hypothetical protein